jgi:hypothetical protein
MFGPKGDEVTIKLRTLYNKQLYILYSGDQSKKNEMGG